MASNHRTSQRKTPKPKSYSSPTHSSKKPIVMTNLQDRQCLVEKTYVRKGWSITDVIPTDKGKYVFLLERGEEEVAEVSVNKYGQITFRNVPTV